MQVQAVVTLELNRVLGSSHEERQALGELQVLPEQHRAQPEGTGNFCLWLLFLHFQLVLSSCVQTLPRKQPWEEVEQQAGQECRDTMMSTAFFSSHLWVLLSKLPH